MVLRIPIIGETGIFANLYRHIAISSPWKMAHLCSVQKQVEL